MQTDSVGTENNATLEINDKVAKWTQNPCDSNAWQMD